MSGRADNDAAARVSVEELRRMNDERRRRTLNQFAIPFLYAPLLPLIRVSLRHRPAIRDRAFAGAIACALAHAGYVMASDSSVL